MDTEFQLNHVSYEQTIRRSSCPTAEFYTDIRLVYIMYNTSGLMVHNQNVWSERITLNLALACRIEYETVGNERVFILSNVF